MSKNLISYLRLHSLELHRVNATTNFFSCRDFFQALASHPQIIGLHGKGFEVGDFIVDKLLSLSTSEREVLLASQDVESRKYTPAGHEAQASEHASDRAFECFVARMLCLLEGECQGTTQLDIENVFKCLFLSFGPDFHFCLADVGKEIIDCTYSTSDSDADRTAGSPGWGLSFGFPIPLSEKSILVLFSKQADLLYLTKGYHLVLSSKTPLGNEGNFSAWRSLLMMQERVASKLRSPF